MRESRPIEEILFSVFEMILTVLITLIFLFVLITHAEVPALIDLILVFGIVMNVLTAVFLIYNENRGVAVINIVMTVMCIVVIIL